MLLLTATTDKLQLVTGTAADVDVHVSFMDYNGTTVTPGKQNTAITTATTTDICAAPASSTYRNIKTINIRNKDSADATDVTVVFDQNGTDFELKKVNLLAGEELQYVEGVGWFEYTAVTITNPVTVKRLSGDQSNSTTTPTEVTGLTMPTGVGTFMFDYCLVLQSAATTTGHKLSANYDGTASPFVAHLMWQSGVSAASDDVVDQDHVAAAAGTISGFSARAGSTAGWGATTDVDTANANVLYFLKGIMVVTAAGNLELWHGSDAAAASTIKAGSSLRLTQTA